MREELKNKANDSLYWLARNLHEWPDVENGTFASGGKYCEHMRVGIADFKSGITEQQWLAKRAELQNKPRWEDHPDARCFVQDENGIWFKNKKTDNVKPSEGGSWNCNSGGWSLTGNKGEVLGDWRDTLETNPHLLECNTEKTKTMSSTNEEHTMSEQSEKLSPAYDKLVKLVRNELVAKNDQELLGQLDQLIERIKILDKVMVLDTLIMKAQSETIKRIELELESMRAIEEFHKECYRKG